MGARIHPSEGIEELNLVEFALGLLASRPPTNQHEVEFADTIFDQAAGHEVDRRVILSSPPRYGLPTTLDQDVLLAAMQLTWAKNQFASEQVEFSRYELLQMLGQGDGGKDYKRIMLSLDRWGATWVKFENSWRRNSRWETEGFSLIQSYRASSGRDVDIRRPQTFTWAKVVQESVLSGHTRPFDLETYLSLQSGVSKRLSRFLAKRFWQDSSYSTDLVPFCVNKLGMSASYPANQYKRKLMPAIEELADRGLIVRKKSSNYFERVKKGEFRVQFKQSRRGTTTPRQASITQPEPVPLEKALAARGVTNAARLVAKYPPEQITAQIENYDDRNRNGGDVSPGWLRKAIEENYGFRKGFVSTAERETRAKEARARQQARAEQQSREEAHRKASDAAEKQAFETYLAELGSQEAIERFAEEAVQTQSFFRSLIIRTDSPETRAMYRDQAMRAHWKELRRKQAAKEVR